MSSFGKYALFKLLRVFGVILMVIGFFGGLSAYGHHLVYGIILAICFFIIGVLLVWYSNYKISTGVVSRGIREA